MTDRRGFYWRVYHARAQAPERSSVAATLDTAKREAESAKPDDRKFVAEIVGPRGAHWRLESGRRYQLVWRRI
jgi:hypothetical protein